MHRWRDCKRKTQTERERERERETHTHTHTHTHIIYALVAASEVIIIYTYFYLHHIDIGHRVQRTRIEGVALRPPRNSRVCLLLGHNTLSVWSCLSGSAGFFSI